MLILRHKCKPFDLKRRWGFCTREVVTERKAIFQEWIHEAIPEISSTIERIEMKKRAEELAAKEESDAYLDPIYPGVVADLRAAERAERIKLETR